MRIGVLQHAKDEDTPGSCEALEANWHRKIEEDEV
jgi:hypothetical protein